MNPLKHGRTAAKHGWEVAAYDFAVVMLQRPNPKGRPFVIFYDKTNARWHKKGR